MLAFTLCDLKPRQPHLSLAIDEALSQFLGFNSVGTKSFVAGLRIWQNPPAICLGRTCKVSENVPVSLTEKLRVSLKKSNYQKSVSLLRRASGGGTVLHGPGNWNYSLFFSQEKFSELFSVQNSYQILLGIVARALASQNIYAIYAGQSDLAIDQVGLKKISGNAQFRKNKIICHHGTLLCSSDLISSISDMLPHPPREPGYRSSRSHKEFMTALPESFSIETFYRDLKDEMKTYLSDKLQNTPQIKNLEPLDRKKIFQLAYRLAKKVYTNRDWILSGTHPE